MVKQAADANSLQASTHSGCKQEKPMSDAAWLALSLESDEHKCRPNIGEPYYGAPQLFILAAKAKLTQSPSQRNIHQDNLFTLILVADQFLITPLHHQNLRLLESAKN